MRVIVEQKHALHCNRTTLVQYMLDISDTIVKCC